MWTVNLDNATFDFAELAWDESKVNRYPEDDPQGRGGQFAPADYKKGTAYQGSGSGGGGKNKNGSSSGSNERSGKPSGPARFTDSNGDGKDDRQLTPAQLKKALSGLSADMRQALQIYPAVLGAIKMALENDEDPTKHLERLPLRLRGAAERAAKSVASGGSKSKSYKGMSARQISDLPDDERMAIPQSELPDPPSGYTWAEDRSLVPNSFYNAESSAWIVDLDGAFFDFHELAWQPDGVIELANGKKSKVSALIRKLRADPRVDDPERLAGWIKHHRGSGKSSGNGSGGSGSSSSGDSSDSNSSSKPDKPSGRMVGGFYIDDDDEDEFLSDPFIDEEPKTKEEIEQEKYEAKVLRELEREVPENIYKTIMEFGGLKTRPDLREEYSEIPNVYKRKDGTYGDEMADLLAQFYPQYGIENERDLIDFLAA